MSLPEAPPPSEKVSQALQEQRREDRVVARESARPEPVTASEAAEAGPSLVPGGAVARATESIDFSVAEDHTIRVAAEETIGHYADWLKLPTSRLRTLNKLAGSSTVQLGRRLKLDFSKVSRARFEEAFLRGTEPEEKCQRRIETPPIFIDFQDPPVISIEESTERSRDLPEVEIVIDPARPQEEPDENPDVLSKEEREAVDRQMEEAMRQIEQFPSQIQKEIEKQIRKEEKRQEKEEKKEGKPR